MRRSSSSAARIVAIGRGGVAPAARPVVEVLFVGVVAQHLDQPCAALGNLAGAWDGFEGARVVMDVGHSKTNVSLLLDGGPVMLRSIPVAGAHLTEAIAKHTRLAWDEAQDLKHASGLFDAMAAAA